MTSLDLVRPVLAVAGGDWWDVARGATLGLAVAAPIGPTALLCVQRTLANGAGAGMATGYGAATAHVLYASIAAAGLAMAADMAARWSVPLQLCGAVFLLRMAVQSLRREPELPGASGRAVSGPARSRRGMPAMRAYATGLIWTLGNPMTLVGFMTLTAGILGQEAHPWGDLPAIAAGVLIGSAVWWTLLAGTVALARGRMNDRALRIASRATGVALGGFAAVVFASAMGWRL